MSAPLPDSHAATPARREPFFLRLTKLGAADLVHLPDLRLRIILANQQALFVMGVVLLMGLSYGWMGEWRLFDNSRGWLLGLALVLPLNALRQYYVSRILLVVAANGVVAHTAATYGLASYIQLYLFVTMMLPVIVFDRREWLLFWTSVLGILVLQVLLYFGYLTHWQSDPPLASDVLYVGQPLAVIISLLGAMLVFRMNNTLLASLLRRSLRQAEQRATDLEVQQLTLREQTEKVAAVNEALHQASAEMQAKQAQLEEQARTLQQNEATLTHTIQVMQTNQRALEARRFVDTGTAQLAEALQWHQGQDLASWCTTAVRFLAEYSGCNQGLFYVQETGPEGQVQYRMQGNYAANPDTRTLLRAADLAGVQEVVVRQRRLLHLKGLGQAGSARAVLSGSGAWSATDLVMLPLPAEDGVLGFVELVSIRPLTEAQAEFLQRAIAPVGGTLTSIQAQLRAHELYTEGERITLELRERENQLHTQLAKMVEAQRTLREQQRELDRNRSQLEHLNENLEQMVEARTAELQTALLQLQSTQTQLVQSEKMATLGQLIAGIAHEINTPIGAIKASSENLSDLLGPYLNGLPDLLDGLPPAERALFLELAQHLTRKPERHLGSSEERKLRRSMTALLAEHAVPEPEDAARSLVEAGFHGDPLPYLPLLRHADATRILELLYRTGQLRLNIENVGMAVDKTKKIVYALKNYAHSHVEESFIPVNLRENLDTIITLFTNKIKYTVQLELDYQPLPDIQASPDELGQVWTNLVHNALQAMNYEGRLQVRLFEQEGMAVVQVIDSGSGIPAEVVPRIFDAFYTTKKRGEGTGLGLHLSKKIIERHSGTIQVESQPGQTVFTVRLPFDAMPKQLAPEPAPAEQAIA